MREDIRTVIQKGRRLSTHHFFLKWRPASHRGIGLAFAISRKHIRTNVRRNLVKRYHREAARTLIGLSGGHTVIVFVKPGVAKLDNQEIRRNVLALWQKFKDLYVS